MAASPYRVPAPSPPAASRGARPARAARAGGLAEARGGARQKSAQVLAGPVRPGRRTKLLVRRLAHGDIALIDHLDIDRVSAEELIAAGACAVLNCCASSGGSYPNQGPQLLLEAGIPLIDLDGSELFERVSEGERIELRILGGARSAGTAEVLRRGQVLARGELLDVERVRARVRARRRAIDDALERFARNTIEHMREERELLEGGIEMPRFATDMRDRPVLVVARGAGHRRDLRALRPFIRERRPVIIAVDGAAEALLEEGLPPHMIVGDMDSAGEAALRCGAELVVHAYADGHAPGSGRLRALELPFEQVRAPGLSEDLALLIAAEKGAPLIVSVGSHFNLLAFLDRSRKGMSSTFLTRLRVGEILVDAKGLSGLYPPVPGG
jgi:uncharacterized membrane-anchored protein